MSVAFGQRLWRWLFFTRKLICGHLTRWRWHA